MKEIALTLTRSIKPKDRKGIYCQHLRVLVDEHERVIECQDCQKIMDAFEYVLSWANQQKRFELEVEYKKRELRKLTDELDELKKSVSYVKTKAKNQGIKLPKT